MKTFILQKIYKLTPMLLVLLVSYAIVEGVGLHHPFNYVVYFVIYTAVPHVLYKEWQRSEVESVDFVLTVTLVASVAIQTAWIFVLILWMTLIGHQLFVDEALRWRWED
jgi:hypothetical protein